MSEIEKLAQVQLPLAVSLRDDASLENYVVGHNAALLDCLQNMSRGKGEGLVYLWGAPGCGRTHLLQAVCHGVQRPQQAFYLPLSMRGEFDPSVFEGLERCSVVCIDDLDVIAGDRVWEEAFFHGFNRMRDFGTRLVVAAVGAPSALPWVLPDLQSRMSWGSVWHVEPLDDADKKTALIRRARARGMNMSETVAGYILRHAPRDMGSLFTLLDDLDQLTLREQRPLTVPLIKKLLDE